MQMVYFVLKKTKLREVLFNINSKRLLFVCKQTEAQKKKDACQI